MPQLAGALGMATGRFLLFDGLGSLFYGSFYIVAGFLFHNQLRQAIALLNQLGFSVLLSAAALVAIYLSFKVVPRMQHPRGGAPLKKPSKTEREAGCGMPYNI